MNLSKNFVSNSNFPNAMQSSFRSALLVAVIVFGHLAEYAQTCEPPAVQFNQKNENIFTAEQEMFLGEAMVEKVRSTYGVIDDAAVTAYIQSIGDRLSKHLPPTGIKYRFFLSDYPDTNAFAFPGGQIMVTRKMVSFVKNEDELAGVIAHELGHAAVRHGGMDWSKLFSRYLNVRSVGDKKDVTDKYNKIIDIWNTKDVSIGSGHEDNQQLEADKMGMFALVAAGYDASQFPQFWVRFTKAKKRGGFAGLFGGGSPADKRLREMLDQYKTLPEACRESRRPSESKEFTDWRLAAIAYKPRSIAESVPATINAQELIPLRTEIEHLKFSPDGKFVLAQDPSSVTVMSSEPLKVLFKVQVDEANDAEFSGDSKHLVIVTESLNVQKWSVADGRMVQESEVAIPESVFQTRVSPDGEKIVAFLLNGDLAIYNVRSSEEVFRDKGFFARESFRLYMLQFMKYFGVDPKPLQINFTPDGRTVFIAEDRTVDESANDENVSFSVTMPLMPGVGFAENSFLAVDLETNKPISVGDNIKKLARIGFGFVSNDKVVGRLDDDIKKSGTFSFPEGKRIDQFELGGTSFAKSASGDNLIVRPVVGAAVGVYDLKVKKYVYASKKSALDVFGDLAIAERKNGEVAIYRIGQTEPVSALSLPKSSFGRLRTYSISDDGRWLAVSDRSRGAVWDLETGQRKFHVRSFRGSFAANDGKVYSDFPKQDGVERSIAAMDSVTGSVTVLRPLTGSNFSQQGGLTIARRSLKDPKKPDEKKEGEKVYQEEERDQSVSFRGSMMEVQDTVSGAVLWSREFKSEAPRMSIDSRGRSMTLIWSARSKAASEVIGANPVLSENLKKLKELDGDYLVQVLDARNGAVRGNVLIETGLGSFRVQSASADGDLLVLADNENRQNFYSISSGEQIRRAFGSKVAYSDAVGLAAIENVAGRISVLDLKSGEEVNRITLKNGTVAMSFSADGSKLFLLTRDQIVYVLDSKKLAKKL